MDTLQRCITDIKQILLQAQQKAYQATAFAMIEGFWRIGRRIVEEEQQGSIRANYGEQVIAQLSKELGNGLANEHFGTIRSSILLSPILKIVHTCVHNWRDLIFAW